MGGGVRLELGEKGVKQGERGSEKRGRVRVGLTITSLSPFYLRYYPYLVIMKKMFVTVSATKRLNRFIQFLHTCFLAQNLVRDW